MRNSIKSIVVGLILLTATAANAKIHVNHNKGSSGGKKAPANTLCVWGPSQTDSPADWQELRCGSDPKPYAISDKGMQDITIVRTVAYIDSFDGSNGVVSIQTSTKEFFLSIPKDRLPNGIKEEQWFVIDANVAKMAKALDKAGALISVRQDD
jgi:hypothetical protein